jgi:hypothetical protein
VAAWPRGVFNSSAQICRPEPSRQLLSVRRSGWPSVVGA